MNLNDSEKLNMTDDYLFEILSDNRYDELLRERADIIRREIYGDEVYLRGLIEFSNYCKNNCYYCGIRAENKNLSRYRLTKDEILSCCDEGYELGFRTFVLQSGEDLFFSDKDIAEIVYRIKTNHPDCAVTLSIGEKSKEAYKSYFEAGAERYLLRHETADEKHYKRLHPESMSLTDRKKCIYNLKEIGYQVGTGFMVGSPYQTIENLIKDLRFLEECDPDMIGIGPYISHCDTPFATQSNGSVDMTLKMISILRIMFPHALIPATTALGTMDPYGREKGLKAGANVVMPNLSPTSVRKLYSLYDNKICTNEESAQCVNCLEKRVEAAGYKVVTGRGDVKR